MSGRVGSGREGHPESEPEGLVWDGVLESWTSDTSVTGPEDPWEGRGEVECHWMVRGSSEDRWKRYFDASHSYKGSSLDFPVTGFEE